LTDASRRNHLSMNFPCFLCYYYSNHHRSHSFDNCSPNVFFFVVPCFLNCCSSRFVDGNKGREIDLVDDDSYKARDLNGVPTDAFPDFYRSIPTRLLKSKKSFHLNEQTCPTSLYKTLNDDVQNCSYDSPFCSCESV
jgi:hypothetical protein